MARGAAWGNSVPDLCGLLAADTPARRAPENRGKYGIEVPPGIAPAAGGIRLSRRACDTRVTLRFNRSVARDGVPAARTCGAAARLTH